MSPTPDAIWIFAERLRYRVFDRTDARAVERAVHIDADDRRIAENNAVSGLYTRHIAGQLFQVRRYLCRAVNRLLARNRLLHTHAGIILRRG